MAIVFNALNRWPGDGVTTQWSFLFNGGYLHRDHVKVYTQNPTTLVSTAVPITALNWLGPFTIGRLQPVPVGTRIIIRRETPRAPLLNFIDRSNVTSTALDIAARQGLFVAQEIEDGKGELGEYVNNLPSVTPYTLPIASATLLGGVKVGQGLSIDPATGVLSVLGGTGGGAPSGAAGGVLSGTYPNPGFAVPMVTQSAFDLFAATVAKKDGSHGLYSGTHNFINADVFVKTMPLTDSSNAAASTAFVRGLFGTTTTGGGGSTTSDEVDAQTVLMLHCEVMPTPTTFLDSSPNPKEVTAHITNPAPNLTTLHHALGNTSLHIQSVVGQTMYDRYTNTVGASDPHTFADTNFVFAGDFTVEFFYTLSITDPVVPVPAPYDQAVGIGIMQAGDWGIFGTTNANSQNPGTIYFTGTVLGNPTPVVLSTSFSRDSMTHVAVTRSGSTLRLFTNGVLRATAIQTGTFSGNRAISLEASGLTGTVVHSYFDEVRIINGRAAFTANFTPPTVQYGTADLSFSTKISRFGGDLITGNHEYNNAVLKALTQPATVRDRTVATTEFVQNLGDLKVNISGSNVIPGGSWPINISGLASSVNPSGITRGGAVTGNVMMWSGTAWGPAVISGPQGAGAGDSTYVLPAATATALGGVKIDGNGLFITTGTTGGLLKLNLPAARPMPDPGSSGQAGIIGLWDFSLIRATNVVNDLYGNYNPISYIGLAPASATVLGGVKIGQGLDMDATTNVLSVTGGGSSSYTLPAATASSLGGVKVGAGLFMDVGTSVLSFNPTYAKYTGSPTVTRVMGSVGLYDDSLVKEYVDTQDAAGNIVQVPYLGLKYASYTFGTPAVTTPGAVALFDNTLIVDTVNGYHRLGLKSASRTAFGGVLLSNDFDISPSADGGRLLATVASTTVAQDGSSTLYIRGVVSVDTSLNLVDGRVSLPQASASRLGAIKVGQGLSIDAATGVLTSTGSSYTLPAATASVLGGIKVDRTVSPFYVEADTNLLKTLPLYASYVAETPTTGAIRTLGAVGLMDSSLVLQEDTATDPFGGSFKVSYLGLPKASSSLLGGIKVGNGLDMNALTGVLSVQAGAGGTYTLPNASASVTGGIKLGRNVNWVNNPDGVDRVECLAPDVSNEVAGVILPGANMVRNAQKPQKWDVNIPVADIGVAGIINPGNGFVQRTLNNVVYWDALPPLALDGNLEYSATNALKLGSVIDLLDTTKWNIRVATKVAGDATSYPASTAFVSDANQTTRNVLTNNLNNTLANYTLRSTDPAGAWQVMGGGFDFTAAGCILHVRDSPGTVSGTELQVVNQNYVNTRHQAVSNSVANAQSGVDNLSNTKANRNGEILYKALHDFTQATGGDACTVLVPTNLVRSNCAATTEMVYDTVNLKPVRVLAAATVSVTAGNSYIIEANNVVLSVPSSLTDVDKGIAFVMSTGYNGFQINWNGHKISGATQTNLMSIRSTGVKYRFIYRDAINGYVKFA